MTKLSLMLIVLMTLSACSTFRSTASLGANLDHLMVSGSATLSQQVTCFAAFEALDLLAFQSAGTLIGNRIPNMPWLRHNRLISRGIRALSDAAKVNKLLRRMSLLSTNGLSHELVTLPESQLQHWRSQYRINLPVRSFITQCANRLIKLQLESPKRTLARLQKLPTDNDYSTLARVAGLYPLASIPFRLGIVKEQRQLAREWGQIGDKRWFKYQPKLAPNSQAASSKWRLLKRHAPTWLLDSETRANLPGTPYWQGKQLTVNTQRVNTYAFVSEARWKQQPVTQLNYVVWFSERPRLKRFDWVAGQHDAVVFRVNLSQQGEVIAYDSIHLCGCWYRLFLPEGRPFNNNRRYWREPVLMQRITVPPQSNPRMAIYLQADTHQIQYLQPVATASRDSHGKTVDSRYQLQPFSSLLKLPSDSGVRPVFNHKGYVAGSERPERWLFWPMGVKNPGALRRFGDHAISFVGRRYFDDPHLLEKVSGLMPEN